MTKLEPEREEDERAALRSAAVEALQSAARQNDPKEFDRLTRYALALIERARAIRHRRQSVVSEADGAAVRSEERVQEQEDPGLLRKSTAEFINKLWRLYSWKIGR